MANYNGTFRTNYFQVTDKEKFQNVVSAMYVANGEVEAYEENGYFMFGGDGTLMGALPKPADEDDEPDYDLMLEQLQDVLPDGEAILLMTAGHEKLRYVIGTTLVITNKGHKFIDMKDVAMAAAKEMLNDPEWDTQCEY